MFMWPFSIARKGKALRDFRVGIKISVGIWVGILLKSDEVCVIFLLAMKNSERRGLCHHTVSLSRTFREFEHICVSSTCTDSKAATISGGKVAFL